MNVSTLIVLKRQPGSLTLGKTRSIDGEQLCANITPKLDVGVAKESKTGALASDNGNVMLTRYTISAKQRQASDALAAMSYGMRVGVCYS